MCLWGCPPITVWGLLLSNGAPTAGRTPPQFLMGPGKTLANVLARQRSPKPSPAVSDSGILSPKGTRYFPRDVHKIEERVAQSLLTALSLGSPPRAELEAAPGWAGRGQWPLVTPSQPCQPESGHTLKTQMVRGQLLTLYLDGCFSKS